MELEKCLWKDYEFRKLFSIWIVAVMITLTLLVIGVIG
jgi:hypothetical protein